MHDFAPAPEDAATTYFLSFYAPTGPMAYLSVMPEALYRTHLRRHPRCSASGTSAMLSRELGQPSTPDEPRAKELLGCHSKDEYSLGISSDGRERRNARLSVLLALFEAVAFERSNSPSSWTVHMDGAVELVKRCVDRVSSSRCSAVPCSSTSATTSTHLARNAALLRLPLCRRCGHTCTEL